jgi:hypothetical protein
MQLIYFRLDKHDNVIETYTDHGQAQADVMRGDKVFKVRLHESVDTDIFEMHNFNVLRRNNFQPIWSEVA